jgi:hypothetical protein
MNKHVIRRRTLLKSLGPAAFLAAPVFRDVVAEAQSAFPQRLVILQFPGGAYHRVQSKFFATKDTDTTWNWDEQLKPFMPLRSDIALLKQIGDLTRPGQDHGHAVETMLVGAVGYLGDEGKAGQFPPGWTSIDQTIAGHIGKATRFSSLQMGMNVTSEEGGVASVSFNNGAALAPVTDPMVMFSRLFGNGTPAPSPTPGSPSEGVDPALEHLHAKKRSLLDLRQAELQEIRSIVSSAEYGKLDGHLDALRELEKLIPAAGLPNGGDTGGTVVPPTSNVACGAPAVTNKTDVPSLVQAMTELTFQAMNCDLTRVITLQWEMYGASLGFAGVGEQTHHDLQHNPGSNGAAFNPVQMWFMNQIVTFIQRFKSAAEGDGTLLSNSAVFVLSEMADGQFHTAIPFLGFIAGQAGGKIKTGGDIVGSESALNDLHISLARVFGLNINTYGDPQFVKSPIALA